MSEKKEFKSLDVGASARIPWKIAKGLRENVGFKDDGSVEIAKNLEIDGKVFSLNGGEWGITQLVVVDKNGTLNQPMLLLHCGKITQTQGTLIIPSSLWIESGAAIYYVDSTISLKGNSSYTRLEDNILYIESDDYDAYLIDNDDVLSLVSDALLYSELDNRQEKLFNHNLTLTANSKTYNITLQSANNLKVDSIADLRTILNINATTDSLITPVCASDLTSTACLQITTALCKIGANNVTAVSDKVTAL